MRTEGWNSEIQAMPRFLVKAILLSLPALPGCSFTSAWGGEVWLFLKDGRVCLAESAAAKSAMLPDGTQVVVTPDKILGQRTRDELNTLVDAMCVDLAHGRNFDTHSQRFKTFRAAATPRLLFRLEHDAGKERLGALYGLQFCWTMQAFDPLMKLVHDPDRDVVTVALTILMNNTPVAALKPQLKELADDKDIKLAAIVFEHAERSEPDTSLKRIRRILADPVARKSALSLLSHYFNPELTPLTLPLITQGNADEKCIAIVALIQQGADGADVRKAMLALLASPDADVREAAAEYFTWLGRNDDMTELKVASKVEHDLYARAGIDGAIKAIAFRDAARAKWTAGKSSVETTAEMIDKDYERLVTAFKAAPTTGDADAARAFLLKADTVEPFIPFSASMPEDPNSRFRLRGLVEQGVFCAPCGLLDDSIDNDFSGAREAPPVAKMVAPIRDYFDPKRKSYGAYIDPTQPLFGDSVHVGDDCGWRREGRAVVCIGPGLVRLVAHFPTWGHIVIVEHRIDGKPVCSLYAHLTPMILVRPGDVLEAGQKIGSIGRANTIDNGGYIAHLHFGIHRGAYAADQRWIAGYVPPDAFAKGAHAWTDPQTFLKKE